MYSSSHRPSLPHWDQPPHQTGIGDRWLSSSSQETHSWILVMFVFLLGCPAHGPPPPRPAMWERFTTFWCFVASCSNCSMWGLIQIDPWILLNMALWSLKLKRKWRDMKRIWETGMDKKTKKIQYMYESDVWGRREKQWDRMNIKIY